MGLSISNFVVFVLTAPELLNLDISSDVTYILIAVRKMLH